MTNPTPISGKCPICNAPRVFEFRPFCSQRCKEIDLNRWVKGLYAIPASTEDEDGGEDSL